MTVGNSAAGTDEVDLTLCWDLLSTVADSVAYPLVIVNESARVVLWNTAAERTFGYSREESLGRDIHDLLAHPLYRAQAKEAFRKFIERGWVGLHIDLPEFIAIRKDGKKIIVKLSLDSFEIHGHLFALAVIIDLTQEKEREEREKEREALFRSVVEGAREIIVILQDGLVVYANPEAERATGYTPEEYLGKPFVKFLHPEERRRVLERYMRRMRGEEVENVYETVLMDKDGREVWVELYATVIQYRGKPADLIIMRNISERRIMLEKLKMSEEKYRTLFENAMDIIVLLDLNGRVMEANRAIEDYGFKREEVVGRSIVEFIPGGRPPGIQSFLKRVAGGEPAVGEIELKTPSGRFVFDYKYSPIKVGERIIGFQVILHDITARKRAFEELASSKERLETLVQERTRELKDVKVLSMAILNSIKDGIISLDSTGKVATMNPAAEEITGYTLERAIGKNITDIRLCAGLTVEKLLEMEASGKQLELELKREGEERGKRVIEITPYPLRGVGGEVGGHILVIRDVTARRLLEEERMEKGRIEALGHFAAGVAHDFNNILTAIGVYAEALSKRLGERGEEVSIVDRIAELTLRARGITDQLLTYTRGGEPIKMELDPKKIIEKNVTLFFSGSSCRVELDMEDNLWGIWGDEGQINQLLGNILLNAREAAGEKGTVVISARNVDLRDYPALPPGKYVRISVSDNGPGIPEEIRKKIFNPFFSTKGKGRGLGLYTAYLIALRHKGAIDLESTPGEGATFHIYLPATERRPPEGVEEAEELKEKVGLRILIMDDQIPVLESISMLLTEYGFDVEGARSGEEALERYRKALEEGRRFDVVLMDLTIPGGMGGKETIKRLLDIDPGARAIVYTGYSDDPILSNYSEYGFVGALKKPFKIVDLVREMKRVAGG